MGNNGNMWDDCNVITGTFKFNGYPTFDEWNRQFEGYCGMGSETTGNCYYDHLPVWASGNLYFNGARAWEKEINAVTDAEHTVDISVEKKEDGWYLKTNLYDIIKEETDGIISTETLGMAFEPEPVSYTHLYLHATLDYISYGHFARKQKDSGQKAGRFL